MMANHRVASLLLLCCCCCFGPACRGQSGSTAAAEALANLQRGEYGQPTPAQLDQAKAGQLIAVLKDLFRATSGPGNEWQADVPGSIASELVLLGDHDAIYWDYLVSHARPALESDQPDYFDDARNPIASPNYIAWEKLHPSGPEGTPQLDWYAVQNLSLSGDARAIPLLRGGLRSPNSTIRDASATGLGRLHDQDSIPLIVARARELSPARAASLAATLREFNDPAATAAATPFLPKEKTPADQGQEAFAKLQAGDDDQYVAETIARNRVVAAIPLLKSHFETETDPARKDTLASVLVRLGVKDEVYWSYLVEQARPAAESDAPPMFALGADGRPKSKPDAQGEPGLAPAFTEWAAQHHVSIENGDFLYKLPAPVFELAMTGDPRGIPLLRRALSSGLMLVRVLAAQGLAQVPDKTSIPLIVEACERDLTGMAASVGMLALSYFDDDQAQAEARRCIPDEPKGLWEEMSKHRGTRPFDPPGRPAAQPQPVKP